MIRKYIIPNHHFQRNTSTNEVIPKVTKSIFFQSKLSMLLFGVSVLTNIVFFLFPGFPALNFLQNDIGIHGHHGLDSLIHSFVEVYQAMLNGERCRKQFGDETVTEFLEFRDVLQYFVFIHGLPPYQGKVVTTGWISPGRTGKNQRHGHSGGRVSIVLPVPVQDGFLSNAGKPIRQPVTGR